MIHKTLVKSKTCQLDFRELISKKIYTIDVEKNHFPSNTNDVVAGWSDGVLQGDLFSKNNRCSWYFPAINLPFCKLIAGCQVSVHFYRLCYIEEIF